MMYKIFKLTTPEGIQGSNTWGDHITRFALEGPMGSVFGEFFDTPEDAEKYIEDNKSDFAGMDLVILPYMSVSYF